MEKFSDNPILSAWIFICFAAWIAVQVFGWLPSPRSIDSVVFITAQLIGLEIINRRYRDKQNLR